MPIRILSYYVVWIYTTTLPLPSPKQHTSLFRTLVDYKHPESPLTYLVNSQPRLKHPHQTGTGWLDDYSLKAKGRRNVPKCGLKADLSGQCGCESEARSLQRCFYVSSNRSQTHSARAARRWEILQSVLGRWLMEGQRGHKVLKKSSGHGSKPHAEDAWLYLKKTVLYTPSGGHLDVDQ